MIELLSNRPYHFTHTVNLYPVCAPLINIFSIKADGNFIYAAQGDKIVVWDTAGNQLTQTDMPAIDLPDDWGQNEPEREEFTEEEGFELVDPDPSETTTSSAKSMIAPDYMWTPTPRIQSMLLTDNHLVALVAGYHDYSYGWGRPEAAVTDRPVLNGYRSSQVRLYEKTTDGGLIFVGSKDVNGNFIDARSIGNVVHLATASTVDTYTHLWNQLDRYQFAKNMTDEEYTAEAMTLATEKLIPNMSRKLADELSLDDSGALPTMMQINQWMTTIDDGTDSNGNLFTIPFDQYSVASNVAQVTSFDVTAPLIGEEELDTSASAYMSPSWFDKLYGTEDHLVLATSGWDWNPVEGESTQKTYVVALKINGASTDFLSVGTLDGHLLNSYALDIVGDELRAATTVERNRWWWGGPVMMFEDDIAVDAAVSMRTAQATEMSGMYTMILDPEGLCPTLSDACMNDDNYDTCLSLVRDGCEVISTLESCPLQFDCQQYKVKPPTKPFPEPETQSSQPDTGTSRTDLCPAVDGDCMDKSNHGMCLGLVSEGCVAISTVSDSCPLQFRCELFLPVTKNIEPRQGTTEVTGEFEMEIDPEGLCPEVDGDCMDEESYDECLSLVREGCVAINTMESCPLQFSCQLFEVAANEPLPASTASTPADSMPIEPFPEPEPFQEPEESRTENYMSVLNLVTESQGLMTLKGRVQIGEKNERITSVRFFDNVAYAVTFERTDPFYVLDMSVPEVLGELKIPGYSSYLHSMNADNTMLVAIGQNATEDGRETGLMVTVFDATDPSNPIQLQNHVFETSDSASSSSNVQWDYKAFRYVAGKLIIPMNIYYYQQWNPQTQQMDPIPEGAENFNGFAVLEVNEDEITEQFRVSHAREKGSCSCGGSYLPTRSFVYNGDLMTVQESLVVSTDLDTGAEVWRLPITLVGEEDPNNCCWY